MKMIEDHLVHTRKTMGDNASLKSKRIRALYRSDPDVLFELLNRLGAFCLIENEEDIVKHNEALKIMADIGMIGEAKTYHVILQMLESAETPKAYTEEINTRRK